jgi:hypothetical protein
MMQNLEVWVVEVIDRHGLTFKREIHTGRDAAQQAARSAKEWVRVGPYSAFHWDLCAPPRKVSA